MVATIITYNRAVMLSRIIFKLFRMTFFLVMNVRITAKSRPKDGSYWRKVVDETDGCHNSPVRRRGRFNTLRARFIPIVSHEGLTKESAFIYDIEFRLSTP